MLNKSNVFLIELIPIVLVRYNSQYTYAQQKIQQYIGYNKDIQLQIEGNKIVNMGTT